MGHENRVKCCGFVAAASSHAEESEPPQVKVKTALLSLSLFLRSPQHASMTPKQQSSVPQPNVEEIVFLCLCVYVCKLHGTRHQSWHQLQAWLSQENTMQQKARINRFKSHS